MIRRNFSYNLTSQNMDNTIQFPFYIRLSFMVISLIGVTYILYIGNSVLIPILMAFLLAVLVLPIVHFLNSKLRFPNVLSSSISVLLLVSLILGIFVFLSYEISTIANDFVGIRNNIDLFIIDMQHYIKSNFHLSLREQRKYLDDVTEDSLEKGKETIGTAIISVTDTILDLILIPVYTFLILLYRTHFMLFFAKLFKKEYHANVQEILTQIKGSVQSYILGLIFEMVVVATLTSIGLYFIGIKYAILLGVITGILNLIPYVGILFAGGLTILASLTGTPELSMIFGIIIVNVLVQIIDNNILVPLIINTKVQINALVSIVGIIIGGQLGGIAGMFLAIPSLAILKIVFDRIESAEPWGYLMGDNMPKAFVWRFKKNTSKSSSESN